MNRLRKNSISRMAILAVALLAIILMSVLPFFAFKNNGEGTVRAGAAGTAEDGYGQFADGTVYNYGDYKKYEAYTQVLKPGDAGQETYATKVTVKTGVAGNRGTKNNPYVISDTATWNQFVTDMEEGAGKDYGANKVYCLAADLTLTTGFKPVYRFAGTFYGMGHTIRYEYSEADESYTQLGGVSSAGLFRYLGSNQQADRLSYDDGDSVNTVVIADLKVSYSLTLNDSPALTAGGIAGMALNDSTVHIINCHALGNSISGSYGSAFGGIVGTLGAQDADATKTPPFGSNKCSLYVEGCSASATMNGFGSSYAKKDVCVGGILGVKYLENRLNVLGCYANLMGTVGTSGAVAKGNSISVAGIGAYLEHGSDVKDLTTEEKTLCPICKEEGNEISLTQDICDTCAETWKRCPNHDADPGSGYWIAKDKAQCDACAAPGTEEAAALAETGDEEPAPEPEQKDTPIVLAEDRQIVNYEINMLGVSKGFTRIRIDYTISNVNLTAAPVITGAGKIYFAQGILLKSCTAGLNRHATEVLYNTDSTTSEVLYPYMLADLNYNCANAFLTASGNTYVPSYVGGYPSAAVGEIGSGPVLTYSSYLTLRQTEGSADVDYGVHYVNDRDKEKTEESDAGSINYYAEQDYKDSLSLGNAFTFQSNCWKEKTISDTYSLAAAPNYLSVMPECKIDFYEYDKSEGAITTDKPLGYESISYTFTSSDQTVDIKSYTDTTVNNDGLEFRGWTDAPQEYIEGKTTKLYKDNYPIARGRLGEIKLYAVWGFANITYTFTPASGSAKVGGSGFHLVFDPHTGYTQLDRTFAYSYTWQKKDGTSWADVADATDHTKNNYDVKAVAQTGTYRCVCKITCPDYPLLSDECTSDEKTYTITAASINDLSKKSLTFGTVYRGMPLKYITFTLVLQDGSGNEVIPTTAEWDSNSLSTPINATTTYYITFTAEGYEGTLQSGKRITVSFDDFGVVDMKTRFHYAGEALDNFSDPEIDQDYDGSYSWKGTNGLLEKFTQKIMAISHTDFMAARKGRMPYLKDSEQSKYVPIYDFDIEYTKRKTPIVIDFKFVDEHYTVTFKNKDGSVITTQAVGWNSTVERPTENPTSGNEADIFLGWYVTKGDGTVTDEKWLFRTTDILTSDLTLTANYKLGSLVLVKIEANRNPSVPNLKALDELKDGDFIVKATIQKKDGDRIIETLLKTLSYGTGDENYRYTVTCYGKEGNVYHVVPNSDDTTYVHFDYKYNGVTKSAEVLNVSLTRKTIDTKSLLFENKDYNYDGEPKTIDSIKSLPQGIESVDYIYTDADGKPIAKEQVIGNAEKSVIYNVEAKFKTLPDYTAASRFATITIYPLRTEIHIVWDTTTKLIYKGADKNQTPAFTATYTDNGQEKPFDKKYFTIVVSDETETTKLEQYANAGKYTITLSLTDEVKEDYCIKAGEEKCVFDIEKSPVKKPTPGSSSNPKYSWEVEYNGTEQNIVTISRLDASNGFNEALMEITGDTNKTDYSALGYKATVSLKDPVNYKWSDGGEDVVITWKITQIRLIVHWEDRTFDYNGNPQHPIVTGLDGLLNGVTFTQEDIDYEGGNNTAGGRYKVTAKLKGALAQNYVLDLSTSTQSYRIVGGEDATAAPGTTTHNGPDESNLKDIPLWQLIVGGVSAVLIVVFTILTVNFSSARKRADEKRKKLAQVTYSAVPLLPLIMVTKWGLPEIVWTVGALVLLAGAIAMAIVALIFRKKNAVAQEALAEEEHRIEVEKAASAVRDAKEEQRRKDEQFKQMFAGMNRGFVGGGNFEAMPAGEEVFEIEEGDEMEALPSAEPSYDKLEDVISRQKKVMSRLKGGASPDSVMEERDELRRIVEEADAEQEGMGFDEKFDELRSTVKRQNNAIDKFISELKSRGRTSSGAGAGAGAANGRIPFAEAYKNLGGQVKMLYADLGKFILSQNNMEQVEGTYSLMIKYKGKSLFKMYIKNGSPYLCYINDNGAQSEICVNSQQALAQAKQVVAMRIKRADQGR